MKMTPADYKFIGIKIEEVVKKYGYRRWRMHRDAIDNCSDMRMAWDLFHATGLRIGDGTGCRGDVQWYEYLNDDHISTSLIKYYLDNVKSHMDKIVIEPDAD